MSHKYEVGQKCKITQDNPNYSDYKKGDIVTIKEHGPVIELSEGGNYYECIKDGEVVRMNIQEDYMEPLYLPEINSEEAEEVLLRYLINKMPFEQVRTLFLERWRKEI